MEMTTAVVLITLIVVGLHLWGAWTVIDSMADARRISRTMVGFGWVIVVLNLVAAVYWTTKLF